MGVSGALHEEGLSVDLGLGTQSDVIAPAALFPPDDIPVPLPRTFVSKASPAIKYIVVTPVTHALH